MGFEKVTVTSVKEQFVRDIENMILSGELEIGDKLPPTHELCGLMGVSHTTVNAGMTELANRGFIEIKPRHGCYVADYIKNGTADTFFAVLRYNGGKLNPHEIRSFHECRSALDPMVIDLVVDRAGDEEIESLSEIAFRFKECGDDDIDTACETVTEFFQRLYMLSDNSIAALLYKTTREVQKGMYRLYFEKNGLSTTKTMVGEVLDAVKRRDAKCAKTTLLTSLDRVVHGDSAIVPQSADGVEG